MFPSVRRVVVASSTAPPRASAASTASAAAAAAAVVVAGGVSLGRSSAGHPQHQTLPQRRYSSSKPSSPDNGSKALAGSVPSSSKSSTSASASSSSSASASSPSPPSSSSPKRKRKAKEATRSVQKVPTVPSTQHLPAETLALSTFFSQHRPISITHSLPKTVTDDAFAAIFAPRSKGSLASRMAAAAGSGGGGGNKASDVIRTLTRAVHDLETPMSNVTLDDSAQGGDGNGGNGRRRDKSVEEQIRQRQRQILQQQQQQQQQQAAADAAESGDGGAEGTIELRNADGSHSGIYMQLNALSGQFLPFQPPPAPVPMPMLTSAEAEAEAAMDTDLDAAAAADAAAEAAGAAASATRAFKAVLNFEEQMGDDGKVHIVANSLQILEEGEGEGEGEDGRAGLGTSFVGDATRNLSAVPRSFFERMALRQLRFEDALQRQREARQEQQHQEQQDRYEDAGEQQRPRMLAISVKRQKKLKMKKKKYKKLMKRTRNLRRKLDRN